MSDRDMSDREKYLYRLQLEEEQNKFNRLKRIKKVKQQEEEKQNYLLKLKEHSTGLITWKNINNSLSWDGYYENTKYFKINRGIYKYSLSVLPAVKKKFPEQTKKLTTSFELAIVQKAAESVMGNIIKELKRRQKEGGTQGHISV